MRFLPFNRRQQGVALLAILFLVVVLFFAIAMVVSNSREATPQAGTQEDRLMAAAIIDQGAGYAQAFRFMINSGLAAATAITYDNGASGLMNPAAGAVPLQQVPANALIAAPAATDGFWIFKDNNVHLPQVGVHATADYVMIVSGLSTEVCEQINTALHNDATITSSAVLAAAWVGTATQAAPTDTGAVDLRAIGALDRKHAACVQTTDATPKNIYYQALLAQ